MAVVNWIVAGLTVYLISRLMIKSDKRNTLVQEDESDNKMFINKGSTV